MASKFNISVKAAYMNNMRLDSIRTEIEKLECEMAARQYTGQDVSGHMYRIQSLQDSLTFVPRGKAHNTK